ncbi:uncharacterized protein LOC110344387 [Heterocephalus glaber]|uniref:Uncharacterized protein LOC110344387 n=1 Tax=Heterocephalus glaber TaxID=10181 RepID=A0AAX6RDA6_HETGA|nr:uncharacterized protein LOC110344387 [Heterocephalus glaber]
MLRSHSPSRVGANPLKSQPGSRKRPEARTVGEGDAGCSEKPHQAAAPSRVCGRSAEGLRACAGAGVAASTKPEPARERSPQCPLLPSPSRAAQPEPVPGGGSRGGVPTPRRAPDPAPPRPGRPAASFVVGRNSADPTLPGEKFCAPPLLDLGPTPLARSAPAACRGQDPRAGHSQLRRAQMLQLPRGSGGLRRT